MRRHAADPALPRGVRMGLRIVRRVAGLRDEQA
jgi:hypothetical protein